MKKIMSFLGTAAALIAVFIGNGFGNLIGKNVGSDFIRAQQEDDVINGLKKAAEQNNIKGPVMVDKETRLDRTDVGPGARAVYFYSFPNYSSHDIDKNLVRTGFYPAIKKGFAQAKI